jgi:hypothetical protein
MSGIESIVPPVLRPVRAIAKRTAWSSAAISVDAPAPIDLL